MKLPRHSNALNSTDGAKELLGLLIASLKLSAAKTGKCSVAHLISLPLLMSACGRKRKYGADCRNYGYQSEAVIALSFVERRPPR